MTASAQGRDVSAYQAPLTLAHLTGLDFAYTKATNGTTLVDPNLGNNWSVLGRWGKPRGAYHEFVGGLSATGQAQFFVTALRNAGGVRAGDMLSVVASDYAGVTDADIKAWCDEVRALIGPHCPILGYSDLSVAKTLVTTSEHYDLWVAWPSGVAPSRSQWAPATWKTWRFWQWGISAGEDADAFNGTPAELRAWLNTYIDPAPEPAPPAQEDDMPAVAIQPNPNSPDVGVSFNGTPYKTIGWMGDPSRVGAAEFSVRVAFHADGKGGQFEVKTATMTPDNPKDVLTVPPGTDGVSFHRLDNANAILVPNFA